MSRHRAKRPDVSERNRLTKRKHGMHGTDIYKRWTSMRQRCFDVNCKNYKNYGGRGITICERWLKFENFYADMGDRPPGKSLDRINNDGNYEPGNCRWASGKEQANNRRQRKIKFNGKEMTALEWSRALNINVVTLRWRLSQNWPIHLALKTISSGE